MPELWALTRHGACGLRSWSAVVSARDTEGLGGSVGRWKRGFEQNWGSLLGDVSFEDEAVDGCWPGPEDRIPSLWRESTQRG